MENNALKVSHLIVISLGRGGETVSPWYILLYNFLVTHPNVIKFSGFS